MITNEFNQWIRSVINTQADSSCGNSAALDDFSPDGMSEFCYPEKFVVNGDTYLWSVSRAHTKGRHLCTHYEIWFFGAAFGPGQRIATGEPDKAKVRRGLRIIFNYYKARGLIA